MRVVQRLFISADDKAQSNWLHRQLLTMHLHPRVNSSEYRPGRRDTEPTEGNGHGAAQGHVVVSNACADGTSPTSGRSARLHSVPRFIIFQSRCPLNLPVSKCGEPFENIATSRTGRVRGMFRVRQVTPCVSSYRTSNSLWLVCYGVSIGYA